MRLRQITLSPLLRSFAAVTLLVWLVAQVLCTAHCNFGACQGHVEHASCHGPAQPQSHHDDGDSPSPANDDSSTTATCLTLKTALLGGDAPTLIQLELAVLYALPPVVLALEATPTEPQASFFRQAKTRDWVPRHEVSLNPAHRSHAPPSLS